MEVYFPRRSSLRPANGASSHVVTQESLGGYPFTISSGAVCCNGLHRSFVAVVGRNLGLPLDSPISVELLVLFAGHVGTDLILPKIMFRVDEMVREFIKGDDQIARPA